MGATKSHHHFVLNAATTSREASPIRGFLQCSIPNTSLPSMNRKDREMLENHPNTPGTQRALSGCGKTEMDIVRTGIVEKKRRNRWLIAGAGAVAIAAVTLAVARLEPAAPSVDRDTVWIGTVERGTFERKVRGHGRLVPENLRWVQARNTGRVETIDVEPGQRVDADGAILELSNPEVERSAIDAENALLREEAELESCE